MANTIQIKRKTTTGAPSVGSLADGEFCLVVPDNALYLRVNGTTLLGPFPNVAGSGSPGGSDKQVQYNNATAFGGAAKVEIESGLLRLLVDDLSVASSAGGINMGARKIASRMYPAYVGPSGIDSSLQPLMAINKIGYWCPPGNATTVPGVLGITAPTITNFTATARNVATTNMFTRMRRLGYLTSTTAGTVGHWRVAVYQFTTGTGSGLGGFTYIIRFGISDGSLVPDARMFMGMRASATPANAEPSTLTNCIGVGHGAADTNLKLFYGGSSAQTPIDLGVNFPSNTQSTDVYELALFAPASVSGRVYYQVTRLNTGHTAEGELNGAATVLPQSTTLLAPWGYRTNNGSAAAVALDIMSAYIETDY